MLPFSVKPAFVTELSEITNVMTITGTMANRGARMKRYNVIFTQYWAYTVEAESEDEAETLAFKEFQSEIRRSAGSTCYDYLETQCLDPDEDDDADES